MKKDVSVKPVLPLFWDTAVLVNDLEKTKKRMAELGIGQLVRPGIPEGAEGLFYQDKPLASKLNVFITQIGDMQLEFVQPDATPNPWIDFFKARGEGIHHLGYLVEDVEKEVDRLVKLGAEMTFYGKAKGKIEAAYIDLKVGNLFIELTGWSEVSPDIAKKSAYTGFWDAAVLVKDLEKARKRMAELNIGTFEKGAPPAGAEGLIYRGKPLATAIKSFIVRAGNMHLEFIQPEDKPNNPWIDFLKARGEGIHHIGFLVRDVEKEVKRLTGLGAEVLHYGNVKGKMGVALVDLKIANLIVELTGSDTAS